jgi:hypothetical protein
MKTVRSLKAALRSVIVFVPCVYCGLFPLSVRGQTNSWTNSVSGNWQDTFWSLGLPAANQDVSLTNAGWKALAINPATVQNFADTLALDSVTISSPSNSFNTLLMNFAGTNTPLAVRSMTVSSNSAVTMFSSALLLEPYGAGMQLGGEFDQNDSIVAGQQVNVGYIGPGVYNFNGGLFAVSNLWVGSAYAGVFNQNGGTNASFITHLEGGEYIFSEGDFASTIYFNGGTFRQRGGTLENPLTIYGGTYALENGIHYGNIEVPSPNGWGGFGGGNVVQSGGTNFGDLNIGSYGIGSYTLSNGVCDGSLWVNEQGSYTQWNGTLITGSIRVDGGPVYGKGDSGSLEMGNFQLNGGTVSCSSLFISGNYDQRNATNNVAGTFTVFGEYGYCISDGMLCVSNLTFETFFGGGIAETASFDGTTIITNELYVVQGPPGFQGSGTLIVSNITLTSGAHFQFQGTINQSGTISTESASISLGESGPYHFGFLQLGGSNSLSLPSSQCSVDFADSSGTWADAGLTVNQWAGSLYGGGAHRIIFGTNSAALTSQQLSQIQFQNPAGLPPGNYPARILVTGEIVPDTAAPLPPNANLCASTNGSMRLSIGGDIGQTYAIEVSTDLMHWNTWTNQYNTFGTMNLDDNAATNCPQRFYRARLLP